MSSFRHIAIREMKLGFRNPWSYSFMALFTLFMLGLLLIQAQGYGQGYSGTTGTILNLSLYLLPLMALLLGSFSLTTEKEEGSWELLSVYPIATFAFISGKFAGLAVVMLVIVAVGLGLAGLIGGAAGSSFSLETYGQLLVFTVSTSLLYLAIAMLAGTLARNRWQALTMGVAVWFFTIIAWAPLLLSMLGFLPYGFIKPALLTLTLLNPAELARLYTVVKLGGGAVLGPEYYEWMTWVKQPSGTAGFVGLVLAWIGLALAISWLVWERRRSRG
ncbi:ABC transporter permease [Paenibacillus sp. PL2-23]|uniref:ABC transporter permease n=1 Tax=Paenibacillus sp. PL2-23 TaxID=2100729 RepID=UPI0030FB5333